MAAEPNAVEQAVSRTLRDNLERVQRTADELHQAVNDLVSACASTRPSNALPSMLRAQTSAAALSATLEVLARFVTSALQPAVRLPFEPEILRMPSLSAPPASFEQPPPVPVASNRRGWRGMFPRRRFRITPAENLPPVVEPAAAAEVHEAAPAIPPRQRDQLGDAGGIVAGRTPGTRHLGCAGKRGRQWKLLTPALSIRPWRRRTIPCRSFRRNCRCEEHSQRHAPARS